MRAWYKAGLILGMFLLGLLAVVLVMPVLQRWGIVGQAAFNKQIVQGWNRSVCKILNLKLIINGQPDGQAKLWVANHISWLDIIALGGLLPCQFVAKGEVAEWPVVGFLAQGIGTLFAQRGDARQTATLAEQMSWRLRQGRGLLLFPEGTTTPGDTVLKFHSKLFKPAQLTGIPVQPIALRYQGDKAQLAPFIGEDEFLPHLWRLLNVEALTLCIDFCPTLALGLNHAEMAKAAHAQIQALVNGKVQQDALPSSALSKQLMLRRNPV